MPKPKLGVPQTPIQGYFHQVGGASARQVGEIRDIDPGQIHRALYTDGQQVSPAVLARLFPDFFGADHANPKAGPAINNILAEVVVGSARQEVF